MTRILVVEDEPLIALELIECLTENGFDVTGPKTNVASALAAIDAHSFDAAVLDAHLGRETSGPIAAAMRERGLPFVVVTGYSQTQFPGLYTGAPFLSKPVNIDVLMKVLRGLANGKSS